MTTSVLRHGMRVLLAALFVFAGVMHLADPAFFHPQVPTWIPGTDNVIRVTGVFFLLGGLGLLGTGRSRSLAAVGLMALLLIVWPGNWWGALQPGSYIREGAPTPWTGSACRSSSSSSASSTGRHGDGILEWTGTSLRRGRVNRLAGPVDRTGSASL
jgi:uncharacterized membrane protein